LPGNIFQVSVRISKLVRQFKLLPSSLL